MIYVKDGSTSVLRACVWISHQLPVYSSSVLLHRQGEKQLSMHSDNSRCTIQTVNSSMYDTYMSTPGSTAKLGAIHSSIQTAQRGPSLVGSEPTMH